MRTSSENAAGRDGVGERVKLPHVVLYPLVRLMYTGLIKMRVVLKGFRLAIISNSLRLLQGVAYVSERVQRVFGEFAG